MAIHSSTPREAELKYSADWASRSLTRGDAPPVSFTWAGRPSAGFIQSWERRHDTRQIDASRTQHTVTYQSPDGCLEVRIAATEYRDYPAVEWVVCFKNTGASDTPIIEDIQPLDAMLAGTEEDNCRVHHAKGSDARIDDFAPLETELSPAGEFRLMSFGGRSSNKTLPFFNLEIAGGGVIGAVGWTGDWAAQFDRAAEGSVRIRAGMQATHLKLHPGEEIRTPRILLLFWQDDLLHAHNMLRRLLLSYHTPFRAGERVFAPICHAVWGENLAERQIQKARWWKENNVPLEYFWIDAGWYGNGAFKEDSNVFNSEWWQHVGNWWPNKSAYPDGLKPVGDALRELGLGFVLWIEPERVFKETYFTREHPEWLLGPVGDNFLFNLGDSAARQALTDLVSNIISEAGVTCYRQDFNTDPEPFWKAADAPDRIGISEIRHIEGLYAFWDELLARHPGLIIDNCSSGGRRIDLETISRSIPLWRSDYQCTPNFQLAGMQGQTHGLARWVPLSTGCVDRPDTCAFRSAFGAGIVSCLMPSDRVPPTEFPVECVRRMMAEQFALREHFLGDFYPLTHYRTENDVWMAWQFDRPEIGEGLVQVFRRTESPYESAHMKLHGLDPDASYAVENLDTEITTKMTGQELLCPGLGVSLSRQPDCAVFTYRRIE